MIQKRQIAIAHVLLWITCTCATLAYSQWRLHKSGILEKLPDFATYANARSFVFGPIDGACYAAAALLCVRLFNRTKGFPSEPGHWLITIRGVELAVGIALSAILQFDQPSPPKVLFYVPSTILLIVTASLAVVASWTLKDQSHWWRASVLSMPIANLGNLIQVACFVASFQSGGNWTKYELLVWSVVLRIVFSLPVLFSFIAIGRDVARSRPHDMLHWFGVIVITLLVVADWLFYFANKA